MAIYFATDFLVAVVYLSFFPCFPAKRSHIFPPPFLVPLLPFFLFGAMQVLIRRSTPFNVRRSGLAALFLLASFALVGYAARQSIHREEFPSRCH